MKFSSQFCNGTESAVCLGPKIWEIIPSEMKTLTFFQVLNKELSRGNLTIAHADYAKFLTRMLVLFKKLVDLVFKGSFC